MSLTGQNAEGNGCDQLEPFPFLFYVLADLMFLCRFVLDEHGRKMSKSLGNGVDPLAIIEGDGTKKVGTVCVWQTGRSNLTVLGFAHKPCLIFYH